jgi:CRISPR-associated exonuclease Cas4
MIDPTLEVTDLRQVQMCARVVWYRHCLPAIRPVTSLMEQGTRHHQSEVGREERRSLRSYGLTEGERFFDVPLRSEQLGLRGRVDLAIATPRRDAPDARAVVVEYKDSEQVGTHMRLQVAAYALLLQEAWGLPVAAAFLYLLPLRRAEQVRLTPNLRRKVVEAVAAVHAAIAHEQMPPPPKSRALCGQCEFRRFCNDVV